MPTPSESQARSILSQYSPVFYNSIASSWNEYMQEIGDWGPDMTDRSRASIVHDLTIRSAIQQFDGVPGVRVVVQNGLYLFIFDDSIAVRFKKLDEDKRSRNIPTQVTLDFRGQQEIPGISSTLHLEAGYVLNKLQTEIDGVYIVCPSRDRASWFWELQAPAVGQVVQFPTAPPQPQPSVFQLFESQPPQQQEQDGSEEQ
jgi:hypothetical protein